MKSTGLAGIAAVVAAIVVAPIHATTLISLVSPQQFAVVGFADTNIDLSSVTVHGSVGLDTTMTCCKGINTITNQAPSSIIGDAFIKYSAMYTGPGSITGLAGYPTPDSSPTDYANILQPYESNAQQLSTQAKALAASLGMTFGTISNPTTITGTGGLNVVQINGDIKDTLTLSGTSSDYFVVNVYGTINFGASGMNLGLSGTLLTSHVLYNFVDVNPTTLTSKVGDVFYGTLLAPQYSFNLDGTFNGAIVGGGAGEKMSLLSGAQVYYDGWTGYTDVPPEAAPEPYQFLPLLCGLGVIAWLRRRRAGRLRTTGSAGTIQ